MNHVPDLASRTMPPTLAMRIGVTPASRELRPEVRDVPFITTRLRQFWKAVTGRRVVQSVFDERLSKCTGCPYLVTNDKGLFCGACGCGARRHTAELHTKLWFALVGCPRTNPPIFEQVTDEVLLQAEDDSGL